MINLRKNLILIQKLEFTPQVKIETVMGEKRSNYRAELESEMNFFFELYNKTVSRKFSFTKCHEVYLILYFLTNP